MSELTHFIQNSFVLGEVTPRFGMRGDLQRHNNACTRMRNWLPVPQGGMRTLFGTTFVSEAKDSTKKGKLLPFIFNNVQTYALEFGDLYVRFYSQGAVVGAPFEVATPYTQDELADLRYAQDNDILYLVHPIHIPRALTRTGAATFTLTQIPFIGGPFVSLTHPFYSGIGKSISMTAGATTGATTLTASASFFTPAMDEQLIRLGGTTGTPAAQGYARITSYVSPTVANILVLSTLTTLTPGEDWALGAWGNETGWPSQITFHQQRLVMAATAAEPQSFWGSKLGTDTTFTVGTNDNDAYAHKVASTNANKIQWITGTSNTLLIGTSGEEFSAVGENNSALGPNNPLILPESAYGSDPVRPVKAYKGLVYTQRGGRKLNHLTFSLEDDSYGSTDLLLLSEHLTANDPIVELHFQLQRDPFLWAVCESGSLVSVTWLPKQEIIGPSKHTLMGGKVKSMCLLPSIDGVNDDVWLLVERTIGGQTKKYVEVADAGSPLGSNLSGTIGGRTIGGLAHLEGETVTIVGDGALYNNQVVSGGSVTIDPSEPSITHATVGVLSIPECTTIEPEVQLSTGTTYGRKKRFSKVRARVLDTLVLELNGEPVYSRREVDQVGSVPPTPAIQDFSVSARGYHNNGEVTIRQTQPFHAHVIGIFGQLAIGD